MIREQEEWPMAVEIGLPFYVNAAEASQFMATYERWHSRGVTDLVGGRKAILFVPPSPLAEAIDSLLADRNRFASR